MNIKLNGDEAFELIQKALGYKVEALTLTILENSEITEKKLGKKIKELRRINVFFKKVWEQAQYAGLKVEFDNITEPKIYSEKEQLADRKKAEYFRKKILE